MKIIGVSQRIDLYGDYGEYRDALDKNWSVFLSGVGVLLIPLPNHPSIVTNLLHHISFDGFVLTGGNDPGGLSQAANVSEKRDDTEFRLIEFACENNLPLVGVCRGMLLLNLFFGGDVHKIDHHVNTQHLMTTEHNDLDLESRIVNSFHRFAITKTGLASELESVAHSHDGVVESVRHKNFPVCGIMWHPEREEPFVKNDFAFFRSALQLDK